MPNIFKVLHHACCGIDVRKKTLIVVCLLKTNEYGEYSHTIRTFSTMTLDLEILKAWLREEGCKKIAIENTGVYWIPIFNVLERDFEVILANAPQVMNLPGKKIPDDSHRTAKILALRLINGSLIPVKEVSELRELTGYRDKLISVFTSQKDQICSMLESCNIKLALAAADSFDVSEMALINALIEKQGGADLAEIVELAGARFRDKIPQLAKALQGWVESQYAEILPMVLEHLFFLGEQIAKLEKRIKEKANPYQQELDLLNTTPDIE